MKKAKIMLSVIALVGIVGTGLAFKANKGRTIFTGTSATSCPNLVTGEIVTAGTPGAVQKYAGTVKNVCAYTYTTATE
jgi:hypothetical protein